MLGDSSDVTAVTFRNYRHRRFYTPGEFGAEVELLQPVRLELEGL